MAIGFCLMSRGSRPGWSPVPAWSHHQARMDSEIPSWCAFTVVAPIVRFNAFEIFATPTFFLASVFISRTSDDVHERRTAFFLAGILSSLFWGERLLSHKVHLAMRQLSRFSGATLRLTRIAWRDRRSGLQGPIGERRQPSILSVRRSSTLHRSAA